MSTHKRGVTVERLPAWEPDKTIDTPTGKATILVRRPFLYCGECGERNSANPADYWNRPADQVFRCCGAPMHLVTKGEWRASPPAGRSL